MQSSIANIKIIPVLSPGQITIVSKLAVEIWTQHYTPIIGEAQVGYMLDKFQSVSAISQQIENEYRYCLACESDREQGYFAILPDDEINKVFLSKIYVLPARRNNGIGSFMLEHVEQQCRNEGFCAVKLGVNRFNQHSIDWYRRRGFHLVKEVKTDIGGGFYMDDFVLEKSLD